MISFNLNNTIGCYNFIKNLNAFYHPYDIINICETLEFKFNDMILIAKIKYVYISYHCTFDKYSIQNQLLLYLLTMIATSYKIGICRYE
jgi:hypothetical protein